MDSHSAPLSHGALFRFATFSLDPVRRSLWAAKDEVRIGGKAFDMLHILVSKRGAIVSHAEIAHHVWPTTQVDEVSLRVQVAALRKLLEAHGGMQSWIKNVPRRGYCFIESVEVILPAAPAGSHGNGRPSPDTGSWKHQVIGRESDIDDIHALLNTRRTVSIVGSGGVGKTTVAHAVVRKVREQASWRVCIAELASATTQDEITNAIAFGLGISVFNGSPLIAIERFMADTATLIVLDNCEQVIEETAATISRLFNKSGFERFLITSREPVRTRCEHVYRLKPLSLPRAHASQDASVAMHSSAVQLFVERAQACGTDFEINEATLNDVCTLCVALDGVPLAIELAAAAVGTFGVAQLANNLKDRFAMLVGGTRDAPARHRSLRSVLDWSYETLTPLDQLLFRRASLFFGGFDVDAAEDLLGGQGKSRAQVIEAVHRLVDKSLLSSVHAGDATRYVFPECTREYGRMLLSEHGDVEAAQWSRARHLLRRCGPLIQAGTRQNAMAAATAVQPWFDDIRAVLAWSLRHSNAQAVSLGISLAWMSAPLWYFASSLHEFSLHLEHAYEAAQTLVLAGIEKYELSLACAHALFHTQGPESQAAKQRFLECLDMSAPDDDGSRAGEAIFGLVIMATMSGDYEHGLRLVDTYRAKVSMPSHFNAIFHRLNGLVTYYTGDFAAAADAARRSLFSYGEQPARVQGRDLVGFELRAACKVVLARALWLLGQCDDALAVAMESVADAESASHDLSVCYSLASGPCIVAGWLGDNDTFHRCHARLTDLSYARGFVNAQQRSRLLHLVQLPGESAPARPQASALAALPAPLHELMVTLNPRLLTDIALSRAHDRTAGWATAEILRIKGERSREQGMDEETVAAIFLHSLNVARAQGALSWELRSAISLARLRVASGKETVERILSPVVKKYKQGMHSHDLEQAIALLNG